MKKIFSIMALLSLTVLFLVSCGKEEKSYDKLGEHIKANSTAENGIYELTLGKSSSGTAEYVRLARKYASKLELELIVNEDGKTLRTFTLVMDRNSLDSFKWYYSSSVSEKSINGAIDPKEYKRASTSLTYISADTSDEYEISSMCAHAKSMCDYLLDRLGSDLSAIEVTPVDFGFKDYED